MAVSAGECMVASDDNSRAASGVPVGDGLWSSIALGRDGCLSEAASAISADSSSSVRDVKPMSHGSGASAVLPSAVECPW